MKPAGDALEILHRREPANALMHGLGVICSRVCPIVALTTLL